LQQACCSAGNQEAAGPQHCSKQRCKHGCPPVFFGANFRHKKARPAFKGERANGEPSIHCLFCAQTLGQGGAHQGPPRSACPACAVQTEAGGAVKGLNPCRQTQRTISWPAGTPCAR
jgi:hypothetical protein